MSSIDGVNKNLFPKNIKHDEKSDQTGKGSEKAGSRETGESVTVQTNRLIIEIHLKIQIESKDRFGTQAGLNKFPAGGDIDLSGFSYNGKPITELSQDEAKALISEDGFFGVNNTAQRIFDFVAAQAGNDLEKLQVGREAILKGFKDAEQIFGGTLPDISYETLDRLIGMVDEKIRGLGGTVVDVKA
jgi:hypothetical protein